MDWQAFFTHPTVIAVLSIVAGAATGAAISALIAFAHWKKQRVYIDQKLLEDRRNERRHQAILAALDALSDLSAQTLAGFDGRTFVALRVAYGANASDAAAGTLAQSAFETSVQVLRPRLTEEEKAGLCRALSNKNDHYASVRAFLVGLLD